MQSRRGLRVPERLLIEALPAQAPGRVLTGLDTEGAVALGARALWGDAPEVAWIHLDAYVARKVKGLLPTWAQIKVAFPAVLRGTGLGSILGILPGGGAMLASFASYAVEKKIKSVPKAAAEVPSVSHDGNATVEFTEGALLIQLEVGIRTESTETDIASNLKRRLKSSGQAKIEVRNDLTCAGLFNEFKRSLSA